MFAHFIDQQMHQRQHGRGGLPEQVELGGHAKHFIGALVGPVAEGIGDQRDFDTGLACLAAQQLGVARVATGFKHHQGAVCRRAQQYIGVMPGGAVDQLHAIAQVLQ